MEKGGGGKCKFGWLIFKQSDCRNHCPRTLSQTTNYSSSASRPVVVSPAPNRFLEQRRYWRRERKSSRQPRARCLWPPTTTATHSASLFYHSLDLRRRRPLCRRRLWASSNSAPFSADRQPTTQNNADDDAVGRGDRVYHLDDDDGDDVGCCLAHWLLLLLLWRRRGVRWCWQIWFSHPLLLLYARRMSAVACKHRNKT